MDNDVMVGMDGDFDVQLFVAASKGCMEACERLIVDFGANVNYHDVKNCLRTPLHAAAYYGVDDRLCALLINNGADVNSLDARGQTPLFSAVKRFGNGSICRLLLCNGANVNACDTRWRSTPLHVVCRKTMDLCVCKLLISHGADVNATQIVNGDTELTALNEVTLHNAPFFIPKCLEIVGLLIDHGARVTAFDHMQWGGDVHYWTFVTEHAERYVLDRFMAFVTATTAAATAAGSMVDDLLYLLLVEMMHEMIKV
jgi:Ankyrin repeats (3 copies)/Ankyrin repeat